MRNSLKSSAAIVTPWNERITIDPSWTHHQAMEDTINLNGNRDEVGDWLKENVQGRFRRGGEREYEIETGHTNFFFYGCYGYFFTDEHDAIMFKLRFG